MGPYGTKETGAGVCQYEIDAPSITHGNVKEFESPDPRHSSSMYHFACNTNQLQRVLRIFSYQYPESFGAVDVYLYLTHRENLLSHHVKNAEIISLNGDKEREAPGLDR